MENIIIQAGGMGSRLETLTLNKPKALVPVDNLPIIFHMFKLFPHSKFKIIADYKSDVLEKYLKVFCDVKYELIVADQKGTASGIKKAISDFPEDEPFMISWCDIILPKNFKIPHQKENYIGISKDFECRWQFTQHNEFIKKPSKEDGIAGLFIFKNKKEIENVAENGAFVSWLQSQNINFSRLDLYGAKEVGTMLAYEENEKDKPKCRPFNHIEFYDDKIVKTHLTKQGEEIAEKEKNWYKFLGHYHYNYIPKIFSFEPFTMERIKGKNIFEYNNFLTTGHFFQKPVEILLNRG